MTKRRSGKNNKKAKKQERRKQRNLDENQILTEMFNADFPFPSREEMGSMMAGMRAAMADLALMEEMTAMADRNSVSATDHLDSIFTSKLQGAQAYLFAEGCLHYIQAAERECNDTPQYLPVFSGLSPQQRMHMVKEVMIGLLCENEPLPQKAEHFVAYMAIVETIVCELVVELDSEGCGFNEGNVVGDILDSCPPEKAEEDNEQKETEEERAERLRKYALRAKVASRAQRKISKQNFDADNENDGIADSMAATNESKNEGAIDRVSRLMNQNNSIFDGGPPPAESREHLRPDKGSELARVFHWRMLCDDAFQEHTDISWRIRLPLKYANFNWKSSNSSKWSDTVRLFMVEGGILNTNIFGKEMWKLHCGEIGDAEYANPAKHKRIVNAMKTVKAWRSLYEESWDPSRLSVDQRCIFAICSTEAFYGRGHVRWATELLVLFEKRDIDFYRPGQYQARLEVYRSLETCEVEGLKYPYAAYTDLSVPSEYKGSLNYMDPGWSYNSCHAKSDKCVNYMKFGPDISKKLMKCSRCKVVKYCTRECQVADWPTHKKDCKILAATSKDKEKVSELCREGF